MERVTAIAAAFVNAAIKTGGKQAPGWVARNVADKAMHTRVGVVKEKDVHVSCSQKTRKHIARLYGVDVWK